MVNVGRVEDDEELELELATDDDDDDEVVTGFGPNTRPPDATSTPARATRSAEENCMVGQEV